MAGSPPLTVEWSKGKLQLSSSSKYKVSGSENRFCLEFQLNEAADTGQYSCRATNSAGSCMCSGVVTAKGLHLNIHTWTQRLSVTHGNPPSVIFSASQVRV